jgi:hypothetical protein
MSIITTRKTRQVVIASSAMPMATKPTREGDIIDCAGTFDFTGGTGKYRGITGHNTFAGHTQVNWPDGTASGYSIINR